MSNGVGSYLQRWRRRIIGISTSEISFAACLSRLSSPSMVKEEHLLFSL